MTSVVKLLKILSNLSTFAYIKKRTKKKKSCVKDYIFFVSINFISLLENLKNKDFSKQKICIENKACVIKKQFYIIIKKINFILCIYLDFFAVKTKNHDRYSTS